MFLAWNEMKHSKLRYGLVVGVIFLIIHQYLLVGLIVLQNQEATI